MDCKIKTEKSQPRRWIREGQEFQANLDYKATEDFGLHDPLSQKYTNLSQVWWYTVMISVVQGQAGQFSETVKK